MNTNFEDVITNTELSELQKKNVLLLVAEHLDVEIGFGFDLAIAKINITKTGEYDIFIKAEFKCHEDDADIVDDYINWCFGNGHCVLQVDCIDKFDNKNYTPNYSDGDFLEYELFKNFDFETWYEVVEEQVDQLAHDDLRSGNFSEQGFSDMRFCPTESYFVLRNGKIFGHAVFDVSWCLPDSMLDDLPGGIDCFFECDLLSPFDVDESTSFMGDSSEERYFNKHPQFNRKRANYLRSNK